MKNAKIDGTMLGYERGILTFMIYLDYGDGGMQGFGGYALGKEYTTTVIKGILEAVGVDTWEKLKDTHVRVVLDPGVNPKIIKIGHILDDKWFDPRR